MTDAEYQALDDRIIAAYDDLGVWYGEIGRAIAAGYTQEVVNRAWAAYDAASREVASIQEALTDVRDSGEPAASIEARLVRLEAQLDRGPLESGAAVTRASSIVFATLGSLAIAGAAAGLLWLLTAKRRG